MNFYEKEMRAMFGDSDIIRDAKYCGRTMLGKLDDELRVKLQFISTFVAEQYDAIQVTVINRTDGVVDKQNIKFADIIGKKERNGLGKIDPYICGYLNDVEWYTPVNHAEKMKIADAVIGYIGMYQDETMAIGGINM